ncbi:MAG: polynucleotide adenylyltransferase PcnB [Gammaproteobacteria bacterium]|nr:MAG: polynucleotide adenylyltransferase PcnB [Gammaproteobacteria bacterium]
MLKRLGKVFNRIKPRTSNSEPHIIPAGEHNITPQDISRGAGEVVKTLEEAGFNAYVVGGCVRDLLLDLRPKDFDVATDATPEQVKALFRRARIVGRRFRIVHVRFGREIVEVTTFRAHHNGNSGQGKDTSRRSQQGMLLRDNVFGSINEDASRRDFTINALYYHPTDNTIYDYANGLADINNKTLRIIGDPLIRYQEDPVRMLRAARFAARLEFNLDPSTMAAIKPSAHLLAAIPSARLYDETIKLFMNGYALPTWQQLRELHLDQQLLPQSVALLEGSEFYTRFLTQALTNTDSRVNSGKHVTPAFLFAALLWPAVCEAQKHQEKNGENPSRALQLAATEVTGKQISRLAIPKRFSVPMREIWEMQARLSRRGGQQAFRLLDQPRFRAAYDFVLLREQSGEEVQGLGDWWTRFQEADADERNTMVKALGKSGRSRKRRPRTRKPT